MKVEKKADLELMLGKKLADAFLKVARKPSMKRLPSHVTLTSQKPSFGLNDGGTLHAYAVDLKAGQVLAHEFCGSADSVMNHAKVQLGEGGSAPDGYAIFFVETFWNGRNTSWFLTVVTNNALKQIA